MSRQFTGRSQMKRIPDPSKMEAFKIGESAHILESPTSLMQLAHRVCCGEKE